MLSTKSEASAAAGAGPAGVAAVAAPSPAPTAAPAPAPARSAGERVEQHILSAVHQLWKSALIVEQGVATPVGAAVDPALERLMGMAQPRITTADLTNQNLQRQMSEDNEHTPRTIGKDRDVRSRSTDATAVAHNSDISICSPSVRHCACAVTASCRIWYRSIGSVAKCSCRCQRVSLSQLNQHASTIIAACWPDSAAALALLRSALASLPASRPFVVTDSLSLSVCRRMYPRAGVWRAVTIRPC